MQVHTTNAAGSTSSFFSQPIVVDYTPPVCVSPGLLRASTDASDALLDACLGGVCMAAVRARGQLPFFGNFY